jgi:hypothetical protein
MSSTKDNPVVTVESSNSVEDSPTSDSQTNSSIPTSPKSSNNSTEEKNESKPQVNLLDVPVNNEQAALNVIVGFLGIAQRRGAFAINESAKIFECVKTFQTNSSS